MKIGFQMRNVRERLAKSLVDKSICTTDKQNFVVFNMTTHPLSDDSVKKRLLQRVQVGWSVCGYGIRLAR